MFKLSFNYSGGGGFDPACREPCICVEEEPRALSMAEIETKRQAGNTLSIDDMLAFAQFSDDPLNAALGGSAFSDDYLSADAPDLGKPEIVGGPTEPDPEQVEPDPDVTHSEFKKPIPPEDSSGNIINVLATIEMDNAAVELARTISVGKLEVAHTITESGQVYVREGTNSRSVCVVGAGGFCLHTHPEQTGTTKQAHRLGFGPEDWKVVHRGLPLYLLNFKRNVFVLEHHKEGGYVARFIDTVPYEEN